MGGTQPATPARASAPEITVRYKGRLYALAVGSTLTIGRSPDCTIVLPGGDRYLSRRAASVHAVGEGYVLIRNDSGTKPIVLRPPRGEERLVPPRSATTSLPHPVFHLVFAGQFGSETVVTVDATAIHRPPDDAAQLTSGGDTVRGPESLTGSQRRVLAALAAPLVTRSGARAAPASYADVGRRLGLQPGYVRNVVKEIRIVLAGAGVPGLIGDVADGAAEDYRAPLARWAVWSGLVTADAVAGLPPEPQEAGP